MTRFKYWLGSVWNSFMESSYQSIIYLFSDTFSSQILTMTLSGWKVFSKRICKFRQRMVPFDWNKSRCFRVVLSSCGEHKWKQNKFVNGTFAEIKT